MMIKTYKIKKHDGNEFEYSYNTNDLHKAYSKMCEFMFDTFNAKPYKMKVIAGYPCEFFVSYIDKAVYLVRL